MADEQVAADELRVALSDAGQDTPPPPKERKGGGKRTRAQRRAENRRRHAERQAAAAKAEAEKAKAAKVTERAPPGMAALLDGPAGAQVCRNLYAMPWAIVAEATGVQDVNPSTERIRAGGQALQVVARLYMGEWAKYLPLFSLGACVATDGVNAWRAVKAAQAAQAARPTQDTLREAEPPQAPPTEPTGPSEG